MRIVGGQWRGRNLWVPPGNRIRPTTDRVRESAFNILTNKFGSLDGLTVLDIFAGVGALGLEALSRGASSITFVDNHAESCRTIRRNLETLGASAEVLNADATRLPSRPANAPEAQLVLMDPPYHTGMAAPVLRTLRSGAWVSDTVLVMVEQKADEAIVSDPYWDVIDDRKYGDTRLLFLQSGSD